MNPRSSKKNYITVVGITRIFHAQIKSWILLLKSEKKGYGIVTLS